MCSMTLVLMPKFRQPASAAVGCVRVCCMVGSGVYGNCQIFVVEASDWSIEQNSVKIGAHDWSMQQTLPRCIVSTR